MNDNKGKTGDTNLKSKKKKEKGKNSSATIIGNSIPKEPHVLLTLFEAFQQFLSEHLSARQGQQLSCLDALSVAPLRVGTS